MGIEALAMQSLAVGLDKSENQQRETTWKIKTAKVKPFNTTKAKRTKIFNNDINI